MTNRLRSQFAPKRPRQTGTRETEYRAEFAQSATLAKNAIRALLNGEAESVQAEDGSTFHYAEYVIDLGTYAFNVKDSRKIAYEGIRRYGIVKDAGGTQRYSRIPNATKNEGRFSEAFEVLRFHSFIEDEDGNVILVRSFPNVGEIVSEMSVILSAKEGVELSEWDWIDEDDAPSE